MARRLQQQALVSMPGKLGISQVIEDAGAGIILPRRSWRRWRRDGLNETSSDHRLDVGVVCRSMCEQYDFYED
jgi:hypothetical protein